MSITARYPRASGGTESCRLTAGERGIDITDLIDAHPGFVSGPFCPSLNVPALVIARKSSRFLGGWLSGACFVIQIGRYTQDLT